jgi:hypothetical protein
VLSTSPKLTSHTNNGSYLRYKKDLTAVAMRVYISREDVGRIKQLLLSG